MARQYSYIKLSTDDEQFVRELLTIGHHHSREMNRGRILLMNHEGQNLINIAKFLGLNYVSVTQIVNRYKAESPTI